MGSIAAATVSCMHTEERALWPVSNSFRARHVAGTAFNWDEVRGRAVALPKRECKPRLRETQSARMKFQLHCHAVKWNEHSQAGRFGRK
jgi:hypothetical protein